MEHSSNRDCKYSEYLLLASSIFSKPNVVSSFLVLSSLITEIVKIIFIFTNHLSDNQGHCPNQEIFPNRNGSTLPQSGEHDFAPVLVSLGVSVKEEHWDFKKNTPKRNCDLVSSVAIVF
jgi:hypothetical protein